MARPRKAKLEEERLGDGGVSFTARITVAPGDRRHVVLGYSRDGMDREEAEEELRHQEYLVRRGKWKDPRPAEPTGSDVVFLVFANQCYELMKLELSEGGSAYIRWALELHLLPFFGRYPINAIDLDLIDQYKAEKLAEASEIASREAAGAKVFDENGRPIKPLSKASINKTLEVLRQILRKAHKRKLIAEDPTADEDILLTAGKPRRQWLMPDQALDLIDAAERIDRKHKPQTRERARRLQQLVRHTGRTVVQAAAELGVKTSTATYYSKLEIAEREPSMRRAIIAMLVLSGVRASELCALRWRDIDLINRRITVSGTKSDAAERVVKIVDFLQHELERWKLDAPSTDPDDVVFPTASGRQRTKDNLRANVVLPALREANRVRRQRDLAPLPQRTSPHVLRRTFVKLMLAYGNPPKSVQVEAGHADSRTTLDIYAEDLDVTDLHTKRTLTRLCRYSDRGHIEKPDVFGPRPGGGDLGRASTTSTATRAARTVRTTSFVRTPAPQMRPIGKRVKQTTALGSRHSRRPLSAPGQS